MSRRITFRLRNAKVDSRPVAEIFILKSRFESLYYIEILNKNWF